MRWVHLRSESPDHVSEVLTDGQDLVDLVLLTRTQAVDLGELLAAISAK